MCFTLDADSIALIYILSVSFPDYYLLASLIRYHCALRGA